MPGIPQSSSYSPNSRGTSGGRSVSRSTSAYIGASQPSSVRGPAGPAGPTGPAATYSQFEENLLTGNRALAPLAPTARPAVTPRPTVTINNTVPSAGLLTSHPGTLGGASGAWTGTLNRAEFTFLGGSYVKGSQVYPGQLAARMVPQPFNPCGYGASVVEFVSDAPTIVFSVNPGDNGAFRILVDGIEAVRMASAIRTGTATAGSSTTITLDSGASTVASFYATRWIRITGGTGAGQVRQIASYSTARVATVAPAFATTPDTTSTFEISSTRLDANNATGGAWVYLDYASERRFRTYRFESSQTPFYGVYTSAIDTVAPNVPSAATPTIWCGDSFSAGTGTDGSPVDSLAVTCSRTLGWDLRNISMGGTGYLNPGAGLTAMDRMFPPVNSWSITPQGATAGTYTISQSGKTTAAISVTATLAQVQSALDTTFGSGFFSAVGTTGFTYYLLGRTSPALTDGLTVNWSGTTGGFKVVSRWTGMLAPNVPVDATGNAMNFNIVLACGHNDTTSSNAAFTTSALQTAVTNLLNKITSTYPTARVFMVGIMYLPGGSIGADGTGANTALRAAANASLPLVNGALPFVDTITTPWMSGTGYIGSQNASGNSDIMCDTDGVHPSPFGHVLYGTRLAQSFTELLARQAI